MGNLVDLNACFGRLFRMQTGNQIVFTIVDVKFLHITGRITKLIEFLSA